MALNDGAVKKSLFIQVQWYDPAKLRSHLEHVRLEHRDRDKDDYIFDVVLDEIVDDFGRVSPNLDLILPYLPGGALRAFNNVFVGSHFIKWSGEGSAYNHGMKDAGHRWANLAVQRLAWQEFDKVAPGWWHGYINHEGVLDFMDDAWLRACYEAYLIQSRRDLDAVAGPGRALLWSPAVWSGKPLTTVEEQQIRRLFTNVAANAKPGVNWLHVQDMMGRGRSDITLSDVKQWYLELRNAYRFDSLRVNMELFDSDLTGASAAEVQRREDWYEANGIPVGASWELRYWMDNHREL